MARFLLALLLLSGCSYRQSKIREEETLAPSAEAIANSSYSQEAPILRNKCGTCHGDEFGSFAAAHAALDKINQKVFVEHSMPKPGAPQLTQEEALLLKAWIIAGGPEYPGQNPAPVAQPPSLSPTFASIQANIINTNCVFCHNPTGRASNLPFQTQEEVVNSVVVPGDPESSDLYTALLPGADLPMPPKSSGVAPLTSVQINIIKEWIENGAKD